MTERITSRKNKVITRLRALGSDRASRREAGEYLCDGEKLLREALTFGAEVTAVLWAETPSMELPASVAQYCVPGELIEYVSPLKNSRGPLFSVKMPAPAGGPLENAIVLENVQDPGNVGTVIRTANAFGIQGVVLAGECADPYNFKTVRAAMGALFRQRIIQTDLPGLAEILMQNGLKLYGAALSEASEDIRRVPLRQGAAVAIGSEGQGLSRELLSLCHGQVIIPMLPHSESLNAAVAAAVAMWEMNGGELPCPR